MLVAADFMAAQNICLSALALLAPIEHNHIPSFSGKALWSLPRSFSAWWCFSRCSTGAVALSFGRSFDRTPSKSSSIWFDRRSGTPHFFIADWRRCQEGCGCAWSCALMWGQGLALSKIQCHWFGRIQISGCESSRCSCRGARRAREDWPAPIAWFREWGGPHPQAYRVCQSTFG